MQSRAFSGLPSIGLLTLVYFIAGKFGLMLASLHASASPVWPPAGIALAALLLLGYRAWPAIFVGAFLVNVTTAGNVATSLAIATGNTLEALVGVWLVNRFAVGAYVFDRPQGVFKFALAAGISAVISPAFGVTSLALAGFADWANYGAIWLTWWLGDATSDLLIAPLIILWGIGSKRRWNRREAVEVGILLLLLFVLSEAVFGGWLAISAKNYPIAFSCGAVVIWTAFRFTQRETATGIFILSGIAIWGTLHGFGPFAEKTENQSLLALQYWTAVVTITAMALSAGMAERGRAEEALRESEARTNLAANAANLGLWLWNIPGDELWVTEKWRKLFGFTDLEPVTFDRLLQVVHPGDRERMKQLVQHMLEHGGEYESEYRITGPDGSTRWIAGHGRFELDEYGKPAFARGVSRDVTRRKHGEEALLESEARFRTMADTAPMMIWMAGLDKLCTFFNKPWLEFTGRSIEQELGNGWAEGVHPDDLQKCLKTYVEAFDARQPFVMQYRLRRNDGEYRWVADQGVARYNAQGEFAGYIGSCVDVTELVSKDEALRESEERMRLAAEAVNLGIWEWDLGKDEIWATNARRALLGCPASGKITLEDFISTVHPDDRNRIRQAIDDAIHKGQDYDSEYRLVLPDGIVRWMAARGSVHFDAHGNPARLLGINIDITARKQAELEAKQRRDELSHLSSVALVGELSASIAHELNQPLAGILTNAGAGEFVIDRGDVDLKEIRELLADISADARRASDVIRDIRGMIKKEQVTRRRINLNDVVTNAVQIIGSDALLHACELKTSLDAALPIVEVDPVQIQQVLINLILNAFDAMSDTPVSKRRVEIMTRENGDGAVRISVRDYGVGISDEMRSRIFEQFFTTKPEGLGMGLAIVRSIVEAHAGTVEAENAEGEGARFHFTLPISAVD